MILKGAATFGCLPTKLVGLCISMLIKRKAILAYGFSLSLGVTENIKVEESKPGASYLMVTKRQREKYQEGAKAKI